MRPQRRVAGSLLIGGAKAALLGQLAAGIAAPGAGMSAAFWGLQDKDLGQQKEPNIPQVQENSLINIRDPEHD